MSLASSARAQPRAIAVWLLAVAVLVFLIVVVGGITRLTESGLSITEWAPVTGVIPPLSDAAWAAAFDEYKQVPQYAAMNADMTLSEFKTIFFWEYFHRLLGRVIGLAFAIPLLWFAIRRAIPNGYGLRLIALFALGALQGAIGWWMVTSGLLEGTAVSHIRLSIHLMLALLIMAGLIWTALDLILLARNADTYPARLTGFATIVLAVLAVQILLGAWTAGLRAGHVAYDWPLMNGRFFPEDANWLNTAFISDPWAVHFAHRWWAWVAVAALVLLARRVKQSGNRPASIAIHSAFGTQILLGIATVLSGIALPLAALHQAVGALIVAATIWGVHIIGRPRPRVTTISKAIAA